MTDIPARPVRPVPAPPIRRCTRYRRDGSKCPETTTYADGWCRTEGCDGFGRPDAVWASEGERPAEAPQKTLPLKQAVPLSAVPFDPDDAYTVQVSRAAIRSFIAAHGGRPAEAEAQIRSLLEDLLLGTPRTKASRGNNGSWMLSTGKPFGYGLVLAHDNNVVVHYSTLHRERTYAQARAGVTSRIEGRTPDGKRKYSPGARAKLKGYRYAVRWVHQADAREVIDEELAAEEDPRVRAAFDRYRPEIEAKRSRAGDRPTDEVSRDATTE